MKTLSFLFSLIIFSTLFASTGAAQEDWPKVITASDGSIIKIYHPQPESFTSDVLKLRSAISVIEPGKTEPVFGTFWSVNKVETDRDNRDISIVSVQIPNIKFGAEIDASRTSYFKSVLESEIPNLHIDLPMDELETMLQSTTEEKKLSKNLNTAPPKIIYSDKPATLVLIDGVPKFQHNNDWGVDVVVNSPFTIIKNNNNLYYLYGGKHWYSANSVTGPYNYVSNIPYNLNKVQAAVDNSINSDPGYTSDSAAAQLNVITSIIVSTQPAELLQTNGAPSFLPIEGTNLLYLTNTENDIFLDQSSKHYIVLLSGRWYQSPSLNGPWEYIAANSLPADFAKIPEGSPKDNVLASIAGTQAAREAIMDAQIPQTAKVDRNKANANITYDGNPKFENIEGTNMQYGVNTQNSVIRYRNKYYAVDNGVWFESNSPTGPWMVATERPEEIDIIPPSSPVYNTKFVYIYDVTPNWVYMGYTPGYLNTFIFGPTVVYGTGFYYSPWSGYRYFPRPYTWGFRMHYNPWVGWSVGYSYDYGWFNLGMGINIWSGWNGGWWGPIGYRPPHRSYFGYGISANRSYGYYGNRAIGGSVAIGRPRYNSFSTNIYNNRTDVVTRNNVMVNNRTTVPISNNRTQTNTTLRTDAVSRSQTRPAAISPAATPRSTITTDREGNVFQRNPNGQIQQRQGSQWTPVESSRNNVIQNLNNQQQMHERGQMRVQNFQLQRAAPQPQQTSPRSSGNGGEGRKHR